MLLFKDSLFKSVFLIFFILFSILGMNKVSFVLFHYPVISL